MPQPDTTPPLNEQKRQQAAEHVAEARRLLQDMKQESPVRAELEEAILRLEMALDALTLSTGGML